MAGAMMVPVGRLLLLSGIRKDEMLTAMAWLTMPAMLGPITGPPLGGIMTDLFGWRSVFWLNIPVAVVGFALVAWKITPLPVQTPGPPDNRGLVLVGGALAAVMAGLETVGRGILPLGLPEALLLLGGIVAMLALLNPLAVIGTAIFVAGIFVGSDAMSRAAGVPTYIADMLLASALLFMVLAILLTKMRVLRG
jgi:MFS family permease